MKVEFSDAIERAATMDTNKKNEHIRNVIWWFMANGTKDQPNRNCFKLMLSFSLLYMSFCI